MNIFYFNLKMYTISLLGFVKLINYVIEKEENNEEILDYLYENMDTLCEDYYLDINGELYHKVKKIYDKIPVQENKNSYLLKIKNKDFMLFKKIFSEKSLLTNVFMNTYKKGAFIDSLYKSELVREKILNLCINENEKEKKSLLYLNALKIFNESKIKKEIPINNYYDRFGGARRYFQY